MSCFQQFPINKVVEVEGVSMMVPLFTRYVSVDFTGAVQAHSKEVRFSDGWVVNMYDDTYSMTVGHILREEVDRLPMGIYKLPPDA